MRHAHALIASVLNQTTVRLATLSAIKNGAAKGELPTRLKVLNWGKNENIHGDPIILDEHSLAVFDANQKMIGRERIALDYEHNTVPGTEEFKRSQEPRPVASYWTPKIYRGEGLFLENPDWTPSGTANALNYEDLSPSPFVDSSNRIIGLHSTALTRAGAVFDLTFFNASQAAPELSAMLKTLSANTAGESANKTMNEISLAEMATAMGLQPTASKAEVLAKLSVFAAIGAAIPAGKIVVLSADQFNELKQPGTLKTFSAKDAAGKEITISAEELASKVLKLETFSTQSADAALETERGAIIARFGAEGKVPVGADGKVLSADQLKTMSVGELKLLINNTPVTVPLNARGKQPSQSGQGELKGAARAGAAWGHLSK